MAHDDGGGVAARPGPSRSGDVVVVPLGTSLEDACRAIILATLDRCGGVRKHAARMLGISLKTLYNKLIAYREQEQGAPSMPGTDTGAGVPNTHRPGG